MFSNIIRLLQCPPVHPFLRPRRLGPRNLDVEGGALLLVRHGLEVGIEVPRLRGSSNGGGEIFIVDILTDTDVVGLGVGTTGGGILGVAVEESAVRGRIKDVATFATSPIKRRKKRKRRRVR